MAGNAFGQEPEIEVFQGGATLTSGQGSVIAFDATVRGSPTGRSFTVLNAGGGSLSITGITVPTGYSVVGVPSSIGPGLSATFDVQFDALQTGTFGGNVIIASSDADEGLFSFPITVVCSAPLFPMRFTRLGLRLPAPGMGEQWFGGFYEYSINGAGSIIAHMLTNGPAGSQHDAGVFSDASGELSLVLREGDDALPGVMTAAFLNLRLTDSGVGYLLGQASGDGVTTANDYMGVLDDGLMRGGATFCREGLNFAVLPRGLAVQSSGELGCFPATLNVGGAVTAANDTGLWVVDSRGLVGRPLAREGDVIDRRLSLGAVTARVVVGANGMAVYQAALTGVPLTVNQAVFKQGLSANGNVEVVTMKGWNVPGVAGAIFNSFVAESVSPTGAASLEAAMKTDAGLGITAANDEGVWAERASGLELVIREGDEVDRAQLSRVDRHWLLADGTVVIRGLLKGNGVGTGNDAVVFSVSPAGAVTKILREGDAMPDFGGSVVAVISRFDVSPVGRWVANFTFVNGTGDAVAANNIGLASGVLGESGFTLKLRKAETYNVEGIIKPLLGFLLADGVANAAGGTGGQAAVINDSGQVGLGMSFSDSTQGLFVGP
ncbi:MAG: hypothetical protein H7A55_16330 [Verrucomicrobiaceae bacterium]|nr:hypothetical protein [Verrucomicrobiaceae bacterium]